MNNLSSLIGSLVYEVNKSCFIGTVFSITLNNAKNKINSLLIADDNLEIVYSVLTQKVFAFKSAVILKNSTALNVVADNSPETIMNAKVISISGENLGKVVDVEFNEKFVITSILTNDISFSSNQIVNYNNHILFVNTLDKFYPRSFFTPTKKALQRSALSEVEALSIAIPKEITAK